MAKDEKLNKGIEAMMTPRRAIDNFLDQATPVDSPELGEIFEPPKKLIVQKRKLKDEVGLPSRRNV